MKYVLLSKFSLHRMRRHVSDVWVHFFKLHLNFLETPQYSRKGSPLTCMVYLSTYYFLFVQSFEIGLWLSINCCPFFTCITGQNSFGFNLGFDPYLMLKSGFYTFKTFKVSNRKSGYNWKDFVITFIMNEVCKFIFDEIEMTLKVKTVLLAMQWTICLKQSLSQASKLIEKPVWFVYLGHICKSLTGLLL